MKPSKRNISNKAKKNEKFSAGKPRVSKYDAKVRKQKEPSNASQ